MAYGCEGRPLFALCFKITPFRQNVFIGLLTYEIKRQAYARFDDYNTEQRRTHEYVT